MKKLVFALCLLVLGIGSAFAQAPVLDPGWTAFAIREADDGVTGPPIIQDNDVYAVDAIEIAIVATGQKAGLATDMINGAKVSGITALHVDRLDDVAASGSLYGPYFNIWVTDGLGNYAVIANEPSDAEWAGSRWDVPDWNFLMTKRCKVYETPGSGGGEPGTSWVATYTGKATGLVFADVADLIIAPPPPAYIADPANGVGTGAPDELVTNIAHGYTWMFGDTASNYISGGDGFIVDNYLATATFAVQNITQGTSYATIEAALAAANAYDSITIDDGTYNPVGTLTVNQPLTITGASEAGVIINIPTAGGYGFSVAAGDVTLENFTLVANTSNINYPIHASGTSNPPNGFDNLTLQHITVQGTHQRTGIDVHGFNTVVLSYLTAKDATGGNGLQITGCVGVTVDNITALNNAWGSIAIYASNVGYLGRPSSNVTMDGATLNLDGAFFSQDEFGFINNNITVTGWDYEVTNTHFREALGYTDSEGYTFFAVDQTVALAIATGFTGYEQYSAMLNTFSGEYEVLTGLTIQAAIDAADPGDTINVAAGNFEEQLHVVTNNLTIVGAGVDVTYVDSPVALTDFYTTTADNYPVVFVDNADGVAFTNLTVDGKGRGNGNYRFQGFGYYNSGGSLTNVHIANIMDTPFSGAQHGNGVYCVADDAVSRTFAMTDCLVDDFQKTGVVVGGEGVSATLVRVTTPGQGATPVTAQNGIQVSGGADGVVTDCVVSDINYTGANWTATGLLVVGPSYVVFDGCSVDNSQTSIYFSDGGGQFNNGTVTNPVGDALYAYSGGAKSMAVDKRQPQGFDASAQPVVDKLAISVAINNSVFTGTGQVDSWGVSPYGSGPITFTMNNSTVTNFDWGVAFYDFGGATITSTLRGNTLSGNTTYGAFANTTNYQDCLDNDWGDASGPLHPTLNPAGLGNAVSDMILFTPWTGGAGIVIAPAASGPVMCGLTVPVTFTYVSDAGSPDLFLYNIVVRTSGEVVFQATTTGGISSLDPFGGTAASEQFLAYDNGDGSWTISGSTVGSSANTLPGGTTAGLFTIDFLTDSDGTAAITIDSITLRDPTNATFFAGVTSSAITVDCTAPAAVTAITAAPRHNKVDVSWTHDGFDVDHYEVFSGVWHDGSNVSAYPEYDDLAGITVPTPPATPVAATASAEWNVAVTPNPTVTNTTETWSDHTNRGVYYYTVFAVDAAGNVSAAPAALDRATNYWLGDVAQTGSNTIPDGLVGVPDISVLGTAFGTSESGGGAYNNIVDVGPTYDWSRLGIPTTDNLINFEDLMIFSLNFGVVTAAKDKAPISQTIDLAWVTYDDGSQALRLVNGTGLKGVRVQADLAVGNVEAGQLLDDQSELTFLKNVGQNLDVSVAVMGVNQDFEGSGDLFVVRSESGIKVSDLRITARATDNSELQFTMDEASGTLTPRVFALNANYPNPFNPMTKISFSLPETQDVSLAIYGIDGRKVATLINETRGPGLHEVVWTGRTDDGQTVASGIYFYRIDAGPHSQVKKMTLMK